MRARIVLGIVLACAPAAGCPDETEDGGGSSSGSSTATSTAADTSCTLPFQGDANLDPTFEVVVNGVGGVSMPLGPDGVLPLMFPPQGGRVAFVGVRATNVDPCGVVLVGSLRDKTSNQSRFEARTVNLTPRGDGFAESNENDISSFSNIPLCPNQWSETDLFAATYELEVQVKDRRGKTASTKLDVKPACLEADRLTECHCMCDADYVLGQMCSDAGRAGENP